MAKRPMCFLKPKIACSGLKGRSSLSYFQSPTAPKSTAWLDIAPMGVDKASALELVRGWLGVDPAHVLVIGDGRNDLGMFRWAQENGGRAVAMAQGPQEVRDAAGEITASVEAGGVAAVLRAL